MSTCSPGAITPCDAGSVLSSIQNVSIGYGKPFVSVTLTRIWSAPHCVNAVCSNSAERGDGGGTETKT